MAILDNTLTKEILLVTCSILKKNFFYEDTSLVKFLDNITVDLIRELDYLETHADQNILDKLHHDSATRLYFTCYFVSSHIHNIFINDLHFSEQELQAFESILPKYTGENCYEDRLKQQQRFKRANYRKFFK